MSMTRAQFKKQLQLGLNAVFGVEYNRYPELWRDIFEVKNTTDKAVCEADEGYKLIKAGHSTGLVECLRLKETGNGWLDAKTRKAAAFLETRRYAAYVGATVEFEKFEGVTVNAADKKLYVALTRMRNGMQVSSTGPVDDIRIPRNDAGAVYEVDLEGWLYV